ncbi:MAG: glycosyltransferase [Candidatus Scalindua sp.]
MKDAFSYTGTIRGVRFFQPCYIDLPRGSHRYNDYSRIFSIVTCVLRERIPVDLVHAHFAYWPGHAGGIVGKILRKPVLLTVYGSDIHLMTRPDFPRPLYRERALAALGMSDRIIVLSCFLQGMVDELGYGKKTTIIYLGFVGEEFKVLDRTICRQRLSLPSRKMTLLYVGNMEPVKGTDIAIDAFCRLCGERDDLIFVFVGDGTLRPDLEQVVNKAGLSDRVRFEGRKPNTEVATYLYAADILVMPSRNEGLGVIIMEALACGTPVVATRVGGIPELICDEGLGILVEPENPIALAGGISSGLKRTWDREYLHQHAQQFTWENIGPQIYQVYMDMTKGIR